MQTKYKVSFSVLIIFMLVLISTLSYAGEGFIKNYSKYNLSKRIAGDSGVLKRYSEGLKNLETRPFIVEGKNLLDVEKKAQIRKTYARFLDYLLALDSLSMFYKDFRNIKDNSLKRQAFKFNYRIFLLEYRASLEFLKAVDSVLGVDTILNEPALDLGLREKSFSDFKFKFLNVEMAIRFLALDAVYKFYFKEKNRLEHKEIVADKKIIWNMGAGKGTEMTFKNGLKILEDVGFTLWFPLQKGISSWMGDTKVLRKDEHLISKSQIANLQKILLPGDIILARKEWYLSNVGLPGFWSHAALYVGAKIDRLSYFDDKEVNLWLKTLGEYENFEDYLSKKFPLKYRKSLKKDKEGFYPRVLETIAEGVIFTSLEHTASSDSLAVLRPRFSKLETAKALLKAFKYEGRPYDFNFDFNTDEALVCSELVYKVYERDGSFSGINFETEIVLGRPVAPPNLMVKQFDDEFETDMQQLDFVVFLDGNEKLKRSVNADIDEFRKSWKRPKWHIFIQDGVKNILPDSQSASPN